MGLKDVGYLGRGNIDWTGMSNTINSSITKLAEEQKKAIAENEAAFQETNKLLNKPLDLEKQSLNQFTINGADQYKKMALDLKRKLQNREITSAEYKTILSNAQENWMNFANQAKSADERFKLFQERNTPDQEGNVAASDAENFLMEQYLDAADLNNKKMVIAKDGSMYLQKEDGSLIDYRDFARPENMGINKVNLNDAVANVTSNWKSFTQWKDLGRGGEMNVESIINQPEYKNAKIQAVNAIVSNPKAALSVIVDNATNGGIYYMNDADGKAQVEAAIAKSKAEKEAAGLKFTDQDRKNIELSAIKFEKNAAGEYIPALTEEQMNFARETTGRAIDMQMEYSITGSPRQQWAATTSGGDGSSDKSGDIYPKLLRAWRTAGTSKSPGDQAASSSTLSALAKGKYTFKWVKGGLAIYKGVFGEDEDDPFADKKSGEQIAIVKNLDDVAPYFYGYTEAKGVGPALTRYEEEKQRYSGNKPGSNTPPKKKFN